MNEKLKITLKGSVNILPLLIPVVPFGIILGAIGIELGFSVLETFATSFVIFGGASQLVFLHYYLVVLLKLLQFHLHLLLILDTFYMVQL